MKKVKQRKKRSKREVKRLVAVEEVASQVGLMNGRLELIQQLIPLGLEAVNQELQAEVTRLVGGSSHQRTETSLSRWGSNLSSTPFFRHQFLKTNKIISSRKSVSKVILGSEGVAIIVRRGAWGETHNL